MKKAVIILFILLPVLISSVIFAFPDKEISELENRKLMVRNDISADIKDGGFQNDIESFLSDQFPYRKKLVLAQNELKYLLGKRDISGAYICKEGRLVQKITEGDINKNAAFSYADKINSIAKNNKVFVMLIPSAEITMKNELPKGAPVYDFDSLYSELENRLVNANCIDLKDTLSGDYFYKTDHHWNANGAYRAYNAFCNAKGEKAETIDSFELKTVCNDFQGTLYSKTLVVETKDEIRLPKTGELKVTADGKKIGFYVFDALETKDKYNVFEGGNHGIVEIENKDAKSDKTLLILKDSFANSFVPYITGDYSKIIMLDERYTFISVSDYVKMVKPNEILVLKEIVN